MKKGSLQVFNEYLDNREPAHTSSKHNAALGVFDQLAVQAVVDKANASGTITVQLQHSADNMNFVDKGAPLIQSASIAPGVTNVCTGIDSGTSPSLRFVRFAIWLGGSATKAHVKVYVTMRDQGVGDDNPVTADKAG